jgi:hypothetical protein
MKHILVIVLHGPVLLLTLLYMGGVGTGLHALLLGLYALAYSHENGTHDLHELFAIHQASSG